MNQKSDQDEKEKVTEKVKEEVKREENMTDRSEEEPRNDPSRCCLVNIKREEEQEQGSDHLQYKELSKGITKMKEPLTVAEKSKAEHS